MAKKHRGPQEPRSSRQRNIDVFDLVPRFLIVCEGEKTEPNYFRQFRVPADIMRVEVHGVGRNTISLVKEVLHRMQSGEYDQTWCVMDRDDFSPGQFNTAIQMAERHGIKVAYSNLCFELWYVLHFAYHDAAQTYDQYAERLSRQIKWGYLKNLPDMYQRLLPFQAVAVRNAERLLSSYPRSNPAANDPCTTVRLLVKELNRFAR
jgi:hypothetical protein